MNKRILYAGLPLTIALAAGGAQAQVPQLTQDQQTTVYRTIVRENVAPAPQPRTGVVRKTTKQTLRNGQVVRTTTTERIVTRPTPVAATPVLRERVVAAPPGTTLVTSEPFDLTPDQRTTVYRTLVQPSLPAPAVRPYVTTEPVVTAPRYEERIVTVPQSTTGVGAYVEPSTEIAIGSRIPASVPLYVMPAAAAAAAPSIGDYRYALIGDRVYLVDPRDGIVVGMLYQ